MPNMPVVAKMADGTFRLVWADPDTLIAVKLSGGANAYYLVHIKTEEEFARLQRQIIEMKDGQMRAN